MGKVQERLINLQELYDQLEAENLALKKNLDKKHAFLSQELNNKEIMFIRLQSKEQECDELKLKVMIY